MLPLEMELWRVYKLLKDLKGIETFTGRERGIKGAFMPHLFFFYRNTFNSLYLKLLCKCKNVFCKITTLKKNTFGFFDWFFGLVWFFGDVFVCF